VVKLIETRLKPQSAFQDTLRGLINTVDVLKNGVTPSARELRNANRIRKQIGQGEHLLLIPKQ